jgi:hypothetical protein
MRVSILTDQGDLHTIEVDSQMELENIKALLEADVSYFSNITNVLITPFIHKTIS